MKVTINLSGFIGGIPTKKDIQKNIDSLQRAIDNKQRGTDFVTLLDTQSILQAIQQQLN